VLRTESDANTKDVAREVRKVRNAKQLHSFCTSTRYCLGSQAITVEMGGER